MHSKETHDVSTSVTRTVYLKSFTNTHLDYSLDLLPHLTYKNSITLPQLLPECLPVYST